MDKGTTIKFRPLHPDGVGDVEYVVNVTDGGRDKDYYLDVLKAVGYRHVGERGEQLGTWQIPGGDLSPAVYFLFMVGAPLPVATSPDEGAIERLRDALDFIESGHNAYEVRDRPMPTAEN